MSYGVRARHHPSSQWHADLREDGDRKGSQTLQRQSFVQRT
jgi:hypothetical protein